MQLWCNSAVPSGQCFERWCTVDTGGSAALLLYMQQHVHKPLRRLRHDNYSTFADIFTTALLQAAATGETLLDSDNSKSARTLQKQADKDASKIFRLNQRMQVGCPSPSPPCPCRRASSLVYCKHTCFMLYLLLTFICIVHPQTLETQQVIPPGTLMLSLLPAIGLRPWCLACCDQVIISEC